MAALEGRVALVTGASQGIGRACAIELAKAGASVALAARNQEKLEAVAEEIRALGGTAAAFRLDVAVEEEIKSVVKGVIAQFGKLDILVNNAGITRDNLTMRMKDEEFASVIQVNLEAAFRLMRAACKPMMKARFGRIISVTSVVAVTGNPGQANYVASKAGLIGMSKAVDSPVCPCSRR